MADEIVDPIIDQEQEQPALPVPPPSAQDQSLFALQNIFSNLGQGQYMGSDLQQANLRAQQIAQNQFAGNLQQTQQTALDAIRKANASRIASGANVGLGAANQLSAILGLQQESVKSATDIANQFMAQEGKSAQWLQEAMLSAVQRGGELAQSEAALGAAGAQGLSSLAQWLQAQTGQRESLKTDTRTQQSFYESQIAALEAAGKGSGSEATALRELLQQIQLGSADIPESATPEEKAAIESKNQEALYKAQVSASSGKVIDKINNLSKKGDSYEWVSQWYDPRTGSVVEVNKHNPKGTNATQKQLNDLQAETRAEAQKIIDWANESGLDAAERARRQEELSKWSNSIQTGKSGCVTGNTLITMADGSKKEIKYIKAGEAILSFNPATGNIITTLYTPHPSKPALRLILRLYFSNGFIDTTEGHSFCLAKSRKCVPISIKNVSRYIGKEFMVGHNQYAILETYDTYETNEVVYSPMAHKWLWVYTNGILSTAVDTEFIVNARLKPFKIKKLITYKQLPKNLKQKVSEEIFNAYDGEMLSIWSKGFKIFTISKKIKQLINFWL